MTKKQIKKTITAGLSGLAVAGAAFMSCPITGYATENNTQNTNQSNTQNIVDIREITNAFHDKDVYTDYYGGYHTVLFEDEENSTKKEYLIVYLTDISEEKKAEFMELAKLPQADNILFQKCTCSYQEAELIKEEIGDTYSYKKLSAVVNWGGYSFIYSEETDNSKNALWNENIEGIINNTFDETVPYNNSVCVYVKDSDFEATTSSLKEKYADRVKCLTQKDSIGKSEPLVYYYPDVNKDGKSDLSDAQMILKGAIGIIDFTYNEFVEADVNQDEKLSLEDAQTALKRVLRITD